MSDQNNELGLWPQLNLFSTIHAIRFHCFSAPRIHLFRAFKHLLYLLFSMEANQAGYCLSFLKEHQCGNAEYPELSGKLHLLIGIDNFDLVTNFTAVAATLNNIGPGLELVGPAQNFGLFSNFSKLVLTFDMLAGRLELFPLLLLFYRGTWKKF